MKYFFICLTLFLCVFDASAQSSPNSRRKPGELIVQVDPRATLSTVLAEINRRSNGVSIVHSQTLAPEWGMHLLSFEETAQNGAAVLQAVQKAPGIMYAQWNHKVEDRGLEPNDPDWWKQGDMTLINAPEVWETSAGGVTLNGDTIVVAILEKGAMMTHPDLAPNRYRNWHEVPGNNIDDDQDGYIDNVYGWNPATSRDDMGSLGTHGTGVCGIIGAKGNNNTGVTGVNWNVKLMLVSGTEYESNIIAGYVYVAAVRRLYNETNGAKGAFVVVTNASFGFDEADPAEHPIWCGLYDSLGVLGVLNIGATTNTNADVDVVGDMPTGCSSEYLIAVTNVTKSGIKVSGAGYGAMSIDIGAPGSDTYTTSNTGGQSNPQANYGTIGGCSAAAPHVAGGVALLYSLGCEPFTSDALTAPTVCARRVRDAILNNAHPDPSLAGITTTGGYLDLSLSLAAVRELCKGAEVGPLEIKRVETLLQGKKLRVYYQTPNFQPYNFRIFNMLGQQLYEEKIYPQQFSENYIDYELTDLPAGVYVMSIGRGDAIVSRKFPKI